MGYIGLLLNAPYKIDSMVWMRMRMMLLVISLDYLVFLFLAGLSKLDKYVWYKGRKWV
jgi:hypothetical protein